VIEVSYVAFDDEVAEALRRLFPEDAAEKTSPRLRWRFEAAPGGRGAFAIARDSEAAGRIIGIVGGTASLVATKGASIPTWQAVDLVVEAAYRGRGVFSKLGKAFLEGAAEGGTRIVWGFPNENAAHGWFGRFGWLRFGTAPFMIRPLRTGSFLRRLARPLGAIDVPLIRARPTGKLELRVIEQFGPEVDRLWARFSGRIGCGAVRDAEWLNWRLMNRPGTVYRTVGAFQGSEMRAFVSSRVLDKHGARIFYVMEAMSGAEEDDPQLAELLRHEAARAAGLGAEVALAWCPVSAPNRHVYRKAGFINFPERLRPITIHFGAKFLDNQLPAELRRADQWYVSYLDSDTI
jgi:GNAT superfamily N-acetyltransferase